MLAGARDGAGEDDAATEVKRAARAKAAARMAAKMWSSGQRELLRERQPRPETAVRRAAERQAYVAAPDIVTSVRMP